MSNVEVLLTVGKLDASLALLTTQDHYVIEFPTMLLPDNVKAGSIVKFNISQSLEDEKIQSDKFNDLQSKILEKYGTSKPKKPVLNLVNVTQTSCVLSWDKLDLGSAKLKSLVLYRQGIRSMTIPSPLKIKETKISGLSIDHPYEFQLKLSTTSGNFWSEKLDVKTHKMTDMTGITVCLGPLDPLQRITEIQIENCLHKLGARPLQHKVAIDTTHFICNDVDNDDDPELVKAKNNNIPIVRPEWVKACETENRIVGVRGFYLDADPSILQSYTFPVESILTGNKDDFQTLEQDTQGATDINEQETENNVIDDRNDITEEDHQFVEEAGYSEVQVIDDKADDVEDVINKDEEIIQEVDEIIPSETAEQEEADVVDEPVSEVEVQNTNLETSETLEKQEPEDVVEEVPITENTETISAETQEEPEPEVVVQKSEPEIVVQEPEPELEVAAQEQKENLTQTNLQETDGSTVELTPDGTAEVTEVTGVNINNTTNKSNSKKNKKKKNKKKK